MEKGLRLQGKRTLDFRLWALGKAKAVVSCQSLGKAKVIVSRQSLGKAKAILGSR